MQSAEGNISKVYFLKFEHGENFREKLISFVKAKLIKHGVINFIGALNNTNVVIGPIKDELPAEPVWKSIDSSCEVNGFGTIFWKGAEPVIHIHSIFSHGDRGFIGCLRNDANVFIVIEAIVTEISGVDIERKFDTQTGLDLMHIN